MTQANEWRSQPPELLARRANSFGTAAESYDAHRPDYPIDAVRWALEPVSGRNRVLDIGAGTGKLTGVLLTAGAQVTAVEPDAEMRAVLARRYPEVPTMASAAESIPLHDASVDAVLAGQAFHWFDQARAFPEFAPPAATYGRKPRHHDRDAFTYPGPPPSRARRGAGQDCGLSRRAPGNRWRRVRFPAAYESDSRGPEVNGLRRTTTTARRRPRAPRRRRRPGLWPGVG
ncbi:class I SAM-dependent methyltransferase [Nocardia otitidiscaviarum]|uniref:class I SAM-dependent methyltransferase n=1 Tax=Nocardia otitidiscaviarum TaxID=1823 RepID=UPI001E417990|nr:class I SAM-dependent methyltransferase [Nocardia otitidiscaviarum]